MKYLLPFSEDVGVSCHEENIDPYFVYATMHRESKYYPHARSWANAKGLMQFIDSTGKTVAGWIGIPHFEEDILYDYKTSISLGACLLSRLIRQRSSPYYALAEYNGGDKRMNRWEKSCPDTGDAILCTELFDARETRLYSKHVMGDYYTYHWLYEGGLNDE